MNFEARTESNLSPPPSVGRLLQVWCTLGVQSFGGGVATLALIRRAMVEQNRWISEEDFTRDLALVNLAPGINLLALAILLGRRLAGTAGIVVCLLGLLLPSAAVTILITVGYVYVQHLHTLKTAVRGVLPAVLGLGLLTAWQLARPLLAKARNEGALSLSMSLFLIVGSGLVVQTALCPVLLALLTSGGIAAAFYGRRTKDQRPTTNEEGESPNPENLNPRIENQQSKIGNPRPEERNEE